MASFYLANDAKSSLAFDQAYQRELMVSADNRVAFPVADSGAVFNACTSIFNTRSIRDSAATLTSRAISLAPFFAAAERCPQRSAVGLIDVNSLVEGFVANGSMSLECGSACCLFGAVGLCEQLFATSPSLWANLLATAMFRLSGGGQFVRLVWSVATLTAISRYLSADRRLVASQQLCNLCQRGPFLFFS